MSKLTGYSAVPVINPQIDPGKRLRESLDKQGLEVPPLALPQNLEAPPAAQGNFDAARANASRDIPQNNYREASPQDTSREVPPLDTYAPEQGYNGPEGYMGEEDPRQFDPRQPMNLGEQPTEFSNRSGEVYAPDRSGQMIDEEMKRQERKARNLPDTWATSQEMQSSFPEQVVKSTDSSVLVASSRNIGNALAAMPVNFSSKVGPVAPTSAMDLLSRDMGKTPTQVANLVNMAFSLVAPVISGATTAKSGEVISQDAMDLAAMLNGSEGLDIEPASMTAHNGMLVEDSAVGLLSNTLEKLFQMENVDKQGQPLPPKRGRYSPREKAEIALQALKSAGLLTSITDADGNTGIQLNPAGGIDHYVASRGMARSIQGNTIGMSQIVPVRSTGQHTGAANTFRPGDKMGVSTSAIPGPVAAAAAIYGSIGLVVSPQKTYIESLLVKQAVTEMFPAGEAGAQQGDTHPRALVGDPIPGLVSTTKLLGIDSSDPRGNVLKAQATVLTKLVGMHSQDVSENMPRYNKHWVSYGVFRAYPDAQDVSVQRDLTSRAVVGGIVVPFKPTGTSYHLLGVSPAQSATHYSAIEGKVRNGDMTLTAAEREYTWLGLMGKVLDVGARNNMETESLLPTDLVPLVTPDFIRQAAAIGEVLRSISPTSKAAIVDATSNMTGPSPTLDPKQLQALNDLIGSSTKKNWGDRFSAYVDAASYLEAKDRGTGFSPQLASELDMSSAGRMAMASDMGSRDTLERVGILYQNSDRALTDTTPEGNPRYYFLQKANDTGVDQAISRDRQDIRDVWHSLLSRNNNRKFAEGFKTTLLTVDYGVPAVYQFSNVRSFLNKNPDFHNELKPYYPKHSDLINDFNSILTATLNSTIDKYQLDAPKSMTALLGALGRLPSPEGMMGEHIAIGAYANKDTGDFMVIGNPDGSQRVVNKTKQVVDPLARGKAKFVEGAEEDEHGNPVPKWFEPGFGSSAGYQIGPFQGQYRESMFLQMIANHVNGKATPANMIFMQPIHDNARVTSDSWLQIHITGNNIVLPKVLGWDLQTAFVKDFKDQQASAIKKIHEDYPKATDTIDLGESSKYHGLLLNMDNQYASALKARSEGKKFTKERLDLFNYLSSPASGYKPLTEDNIDTRDTTYTKAQALNMYMKLYTTMLNTTFDTGKTLNKITQWESIGLSKKRVTMPEIQARAARNKINNFN